MTNTPSSIQWLLNWAIAYATPYLVDYGAGYANLQSKIFFVWFGACFICIVFVCEYRVLSPRPTCQWGG